MPDERDGLPIDDDLELDLSGDGGGESAGDAKGNPAKKAPKAKGAGSGSAKTPSETELKRRIDEGLEEVIGVVRDFFGSDHVASAIEEDKKRMAEVLAAHAMKRARVATWVVRLFGKDSAVAAARAFGPTLRLVGGALRDRGAPRGPAGTDELEGWQDDQGVYHVGDRPDA